MIPKSALVRHSKDPLPFWRDSAELPWRCEDISLFLSSTTIVIPHSPSTLAHPILWRPLMEVFGGIEIKLAAMLEAGLTVRQYVYVNNSQVSTRVARHRFHQLMMLNPQQLHLTAIHGCFAHFPHDVTLISEVDFR